MPIIHAKVIQGIFNAEQNADIGRDLADTMVTIEGEAMRAVASDVAEELRGRDSGIAGRPLTTADVEALAAGGA